MAYIEKMRRSERGTNFRICFFLHKKRRRLSLGSHFTAKQAEQIRGHVEEIVDSIETGSRLGKSTAGFLAEMPADLRKRFIAAGLMEDNRVTLNELWQRFYSETAANRKPATETTYRTVEKRFFAFFAGGLDPNEITRKDGEAWKEWLIEQGYAEASVAGSIQKVHAVWNFGAEQGYIPANPWKGIRRGSMRNPNRMFFVPMDWYEKILDACPDQTWRTIIALCRIGGLRNPSETLRLTWHDLDFANGSILVHSVKTEHHSGKETRLIPMFPRLREELVRLWEQTEEGGSPYVIDRYRDTSANMRTQLQRIIFLAGLPEWERLFQNLRESRANELWTEYPEHVAGAWMGHSKRVATEHYLQVTDEQFQRALKASEPAQSPRGGELEPSRKKRGLKRGHGLVKFN